MTPTGDLLFQASASSSVKWGSNSGHLPGTRTLYRPDGASSNGLGQQWLSRSCWNMGTSRMTVPIPVPADGTQTKHPDFALQQDKEKPVPSQGNLISTPPHEPRAQPGPRSAHWEPQHLRTYFALVPRPCLALEGLLGQLGVGSGQTDQQGEPEVIKDPGSRGAAEVGRPAPWRRGQDHFGNEEVIPGSGSCRGKGPAGGLQATERRGKDPSGRQQKAVGSLALRLQWGYPWTIFSLGLIFINCFNELPLANRLEGQDWELRD